jgi:hypothetical protein
MGDKEYAMGSIIRPYLKIRNSMSTGDIILMHGIDVESEIIELAERSPWSHVAMVLRTVIEDPPLLWESTPLHFTKDVMLNIRISGARIVSLEDRLRIGMERRLYSRFALRRLEATLTPDMLGALRDYIEQVHQLRYPTTWELAEDYMKGRVLDETASFDHVYCAELIADTYMHMGLLSGDHPPNRYTPKDFSSEGRLSLLKGAYLSEEIYFAPGTDFPVDSDIC